MKLTILNLISLCTLFNFNLFSQADTWTQVIGDGFGNILNKGIVEFFEFKNKLYATTQTEIGDGPAEIYYSDDGLTSWTQVISFSPPITIGDNTIPTVGVTDLGGGIAFFGTAHGMTGGAVYRSTDGPTWNQINGLPFYFPITKLRGVTGTYWEV